MGIIYLISPDFYVDLFLINRHGAWKECGNALSQTPKTEAAAMTSATEHRQVVYRLLPERRANWQWLNAAPNAQRELYNAAPEERIAAHRMAGKTITFYDQCKSLTLCRRDIPEMRAASVRIQRGTLRRLDEAFKAFFRRCKGGETPGFPKFRGKRRFNSLSIAEGVRVRGDRIRIPAFGQMTIRRKGGNPHANGTPKSAVPKREGGRWHVILCFGVPVAERHDNGVAAGVDRNAGSIAIADTEGRAEIVAMPDDARIRRHQRALSRGKRGSKRRMPANTMRRKANRRSNWRHRTSRKLTDGHGAVVVERLNAKGMTGSARGTADNPGANVKARSGLNRVIPDSGCRGLAQKLRCKARTVVEINPAHTSQTRHACGHVDKANRRGKGFKCVSCGHADHADLNAARNILALGTGATARGGGGVARPVKRENDALAA